MSNNFLPSTDVLIQCIDLMFWLCVCVLFGGAFSNTIVQYFSRRTCLPNTGTSGGGGVGGPLTTIFFTSICTTRRDNQVVVYCLTQSSCECDVYCKLLYKHVSVSLPVLSALAGCPSKKFCLCGALSVSADIRGLWCSV